MKRGDKLVCKIIALGKWSEGFTTPPLLSDKGKE